MLSISNPDGTVKRSTNDYAEMRRFFTKAKVLIGHNIRRFDIPVVEKLLGVKIKAKIRDTLAISWALYPTRDKHGLAWWGEEFGVPKPKIDDWESLTYEEYRHRCEEDVEINRLLWLKMQKLLIDLYGNSIKINEYLEYIDFKMYCARLQEKSGWHVDLNRARTALQNMNNEKDAKVKELAKAMPLVPVYRERYRPKIFYKKDGTLSSKALEWLSLCSEHRVNSLEFEGPIQILVQHEEPNPNSVTQIKDWLTSLGWKPGTLKQVKNKKTGETRDVPQINLDQGKGICPSIKRLYGKEPRLELLDGLSILSHRISTIKGIIENTKEGQATEDGDSRSSGARVMAQVKGLTNTLRFQHTTVVNLPKVDKLYASDIRSSLISPPGFILCGSDMSSLEDRIKQHFIFPHDPDYVLSMNQPDFDPHLTVAGLAGMLTEEEILSYKQGDKTKKSVRDIAKNGNYACQYGAGVARLMITCGINREAATRLYEAYWELNWAVKKVASEQKIKEIDGQMWLKNPINGFYYSLRMMKDVFSTLVQGTASYVFDMWVKYILEKRPQLTASFHDEIILCIKEGFEEQCTKLITEAINKTNEILKLNRELGVDIQYGHNYGLIH